MKIKIVISGLLLGLIISGHNVKGQTAIEDILAINKTYHNTKRFSIDIKLQMFTNASDNYPAYQYTGAIRKDFPSYFSEMMGQTYLNNERCRLTINENQKRIIYAHSSNENNPIGDDQMVGIVDSMVKTYGSIILVSSSASSRTYKITSRNKGSMYKYILITIDTGLKVISRIVYHYVTGGQFEKVVIDYYNIKLNCTLPPGTFSEKKYIKVIGDEILPSKQYSGYRIVRRTSDSNN